MNPPRSRSDDDRVRHIREAATKLTKAEKLGVPVLDEAGFEHLLETGELP